jgi:DNA-binding transcriptional LysR family regulator
MLAFEVLELNLDDRTVNLLEEGLDLAIRIGLLADSTLMARRLATVHQIICASPAYLAEHGEPRVPEDLKHHLALNYSNLPESQMWQFVLPDDKTVSVRFPARLRANGDVLLQAQLMGWVWCHRFYLLRSHQQGITRAAELSATRYLCICYLSIAKTFAATGSGIN